MVDTSGRQEGFSCPKIKNEREKNNAFSTFETAKRFMEDASKRGGYACIEKEDCTGASWGKPASEVSEKRGGGEERATQFVESAVSTAKNWGFP